MERKVEYWRRGLPHFHHVGACFFVTWRLHGSLPKEVVARIRQETGIAGLDGQKVGQPSSRKKAVYQQRLDDYLDRAEDGPHCLRDPRVAGIVLDRIRQYDGLYYILEACCVMSNHVHALLNFGLQMPEREDGFDMRKYVNLEKVLGLIKGGSAFLINKMRGNQGKRFWSEMNFDRYIRDERHFEAALSYIINNPVKAGICRDWRSFPFTYVSKENRERYGLGDGRAGL
jgi:putative transposase